MTVADNQIDRAITASTIKNVSMAYVPRDKNDCAYSSPRGCSELLTIDNKCRGLSAFTGAA
jgi:hypothetical protein